MNHRYLIIIVLLVIGLFFLSMIINLNLNGQNQSAEPVSQLDDRVTLGGQTFIAELAKTPAERAQGLSGRDPLRDGQAMLFVFEDNALHGFWMKDMKFAIDIIWIQDNQVVDIWANAQPPSNGEIPRYMPQVEASYVLEVNAGFVEQSGLKIGDDVIIDINN